MQEIQNCKFNFKKFLLSVVAIMLLLAMPDIIYSNISETFKFTRDYKAIMLLLPLAIGLYTCRWKFILYTFLSLFCCLQIMQFIHIGYFGSRLSPYALVLLKLEKNDVLSEGLKIWKQYWYIFPMVILPYSSIAYFNIKNQTSKHWISLAFLIIPLMWLGSVRFAPNPCRITLDNSIKALTGFIRLQFRNTTYQNYQPYEITKSHEITQPTNIVLIIGESVNYSHMSLFGYTKNDTTPRLKELSRNENFYYTAGISSAISTYSSTKFMTNAICEPDNIRQVFLDDTNIFKLAKQAGFKTYYLSTQKDYLMVNLSGCTYLDHFFTFNTSPLSILKDRDITLINESKTLDLSEKNLIVLHQSSIHSPYKHTYGQSYTPNIEFNNNENEILNDYDNAMLYNDYLISEMFNIFNKSTGTFYIFWASDHNELLGENGNWGHGTGNLYPECANIPVLMQTNDLEFLNKFKNIFRPTHYDITKSIINLMGFTLNNPNEKPNEFYVNGVDFTGQMGYMHGIKDPKNKTVTFDYSYNPLLSTIFTKTRDAFRKHPHAN